VALTRPELNPLDISTHQHPQTSLERELAQDNLPAAMYLQPITAANSVSQNTTEPVHKHLNSLYSLLQSMITKMISSDMKGVRSIQPAIGVIFNTLYDSTPCANNPGLQLLVL
jgi:hypothetical protein